MTFIVGFLVVIGCVLGGYAAMGGHIAVLWQPFEFIIIFGAAIGAFVIGNPKHVLGKAPKAFGAVLKGASLGKPEYLELLTMMYSVFKLAKSKGMLALEAHIEKPEESDLFQKFPKFLHHHHAVHFLCDYMRMMTMGSENPHQMEDLMNEELEIHHQEDHHLQSSMQTLADSTPALGIVAAVLGVIHTMGSINSPPEVLGHLIGGALVGTFMGILVSYGIMAPIAQGLGAVQMSEAKYLQCIKAGLLAYMNGYAPAVAVEFARKSINSENRPSFYELEEEINNLTA